MRKTTCSLINPRPLLLDMTPPGISLDSRSIADLVRLRAAIEHARLLAEDLSDHGSRIALVALDGAVEYAMWLTVQSAGLPLNERANFHETMKTLINHHKGAWEQHGRRGVLQIHTARNVAQHGGAGPDPSLMAGWVEDADVFVTSLVAATYGVELGDVFLANAVRTSSLRERIESVEVAINAEDPDRAFGCAYQAFTETRELWREQQGDAYGYMALYSSVDVDPRHRDPSERAVDYADVGVFTNDLGEYHWLITTQRMVAGGAPCTLQDARRALQFVYRWILRWQTFDARYPRERWQEHFDSQVPPTTGDDQPPTIVDVEVLGTVQIGPQVLNEIVLQIANIPERGRGGWGEGIPGALQRAREGVGLQDTTVTPGETTPTGRFKFLADRGISETQLAECLKFTVAGATNNYLERRAKLTRLEAEADRYAAEYAAVFAPHRDLFGDVYADKYLSSGGEFLAVRVPFDGTIEELSQIVAVLEGHDKWPNDVRRTNTELILTAEPLGDTSREALGAALVEAHEGIEEIRRKVAQDERQREQLETTLRAQLISQP